MTDQSNPCTRLLLSTTAHLYSWFACPCKSFRASSRPVDIFLACLNEACICARACTCCFTHQAKTIPRWQRFYLQIYACSFACNCCFFSPHQAKAIRKSKNFTCKSYTAVAYSYVCGCAMIFAYTQMNELGAVAQFCSLISHPICLH